MKASAVLLIILIFFAQTAGAESSSGQMPEEMTAESILGFTRYCVNRGEFYRASSELDRLNSLYPGFISPHVYSVSRNYFFFRGEQYDTVKKELSVSYSPTSSLNIFNVDAFFITGDYSGMNSLVSGIPLTTGPYFEMLFKRRVLAGIMLDDSEAIDSLERMYSGEFSRYHELVEFAAAEREREKSPALAVMLGVVPGMGYVYAGNTATGIVALTVVALTGVLACAAAANDCMATSVFLCTISSLFYGGSIMGGYLTAMRFNREVRQSVMQECIYRTALLRDHETIYNKEGLGSLK